MCGIVGYVDYSSKTQKKVLRVMREEISHRGPDSSGEFISNGNLAGLGIRRLSIVDLKSGDQPIANEDGSITVVYNGEIYNYVEIRNRLLKKGHKFKTRSDTEVLVHLYEDYGEKMTKFLNGMFAFAIWDDKAKKLFIARDRSGIKPLYYFRNGDLLVFGSEIKTTLKHPRFKVKIDPRSLDMYCYFGYLPADKSMLVDLHKLLPGHTLTFSKSGLKIDKYFEVRIDSSPPKVTLDRLLDEAVKKQLQADVPVGVFLSGGLDSSLIAYYAGKHKEKIKSFSIAFGEKSFDESKYAKLVAKRLGTEHYEENFSVNDVYDLYDQITDKLDEPLADPSLFPTYKLSKWASGHVKVALSGDGGDELFGGYPTYQGQIISNILKYTPQILLNFGVDFLGLLPQSDKNYPKSLLAKILLKSSKMEPVERQLYMMRTFFLGDDLVRNKPGMNFVRDSIPIKESMSITTKAQIVDFYTYLRDAFLVKTDRASMFNSLEVRVPFLDNSIIEYAFNSNHKHVNLLRTKILLRKLAEKKLALPEITNRPKKGFGIPVSKWLKNELKNFAYDVLTYNKLEEHVGKDTLQKVWNDHQNGKSNNGGALWMLMMLSGWLKKWT